MCNPGPHMLSPSCGNPRYREIAPITRLPLLACCHHTSSHHYTCTHARFLPQVVGTIRSEVAQELGLSPDVQVAPGSGDNQMSALGAGAVHEGTWVMSLGTSGTLFGLSTKPVLDPSGAVSPFCDATGSWLPLLCTMNCTTVTEEVSLVIKPYLRQTQLDASQDLHL